MVNEIKNVAFRNNMKPNLWDAGVLALVGLYFNSRLNGNKGDYLLRAGIGLGTGIGAAVYGPELAKKGLDYVKKFDKDELAKVGIGGVTGILGYSLSDVVVDRVKQYRTQKNASP